MTNSITNKQMVFILFSAIITTNTIDLPNIAAQAAGRSSWIQLIAFSIPFGLGAFIIAKLNNMYQGKVFFDYSQEIVGKFLTYLVAVYFTLHLFLIGVYLKLKLLGLLTSNFLPKTPQFIILFFGIAVFGYVAYKGVTNIARMFEIYGVLFLFITVGICVLMLTQGTVENILPFYNPIEAKRFLSTMKDYIAPYDGIEILLIVPFTARNKKAPITAFFTLVFIGLFYVLIVESTIMSLGINNTIAYNDAFIEAVKITEMPVLERVDIFYLTFGLSGLFSGMIIVYTAALEFACRIFPKVKRWIMVTSICIAFYVLCLIAMGIPDFTEIAIENSSFLVLASSFFIPITWFIIAKIKKRAAQ